MKKAFLRKNDEGEEIPTFILQMAHTYIWFSTSFKSQDTIDQSFYSFQIELSEQSYILELKHQENKKD